MARQMPTMTPSDSVSDGFSFCIASWSLSLSSATFVGGGGEATEIAMVGAEVTTMPSAAEAASGVPRLVESAFRTPMALLEAGTAMVAVMSTLAAVTWTSTSDESTPAAEAKFCFKLALTSGV